MKGWIYCSELEDLMRSWKRSFKVLFRRISI